MFYVSKNILKDEHLAEDAVHAAFLKVIDNLDKIDDVDSSKTKGYVAIIAERVSIDMYRKLKRETTSLDTFDYESSMDPHFDEYDESGGEPLSIAIAQLPENYREVVLLRFRHDLTTNEIAKTLDISEENVHKRIQRAKKKLKDILISQNSHLTN